MFANILSAYPIYTNVISLDLCCEAVAIKIIITHSEYPGEKTPVVVFFPVSFPINLALQLKRKRVAKATPNLGLNYNAS